MGGALGWGWCLALGVSMSGCAGSPSRPTPPSTIEVGESDPEPAPPVEETAHGTVDEQLLGALRDALMDQTYGTPGDPERFVNAYLWSLFVPRTAAVPELKRYNLRFLQENPNWEYDDPREGLADRLFAVSRKSEFLLGAFAKNKAWLYANLSTAQYRELHLDVYVTGLLRVNRQIFSRPDAANRLRAMSIGLSMEPGGDPSVPYPATTLQISPPYFKDMWSPEAAVYVESELCKGDTACSVKAKRLTLWMHGFWLRRSVEQNAAAVKQILEEIAKHYSG